MSGIAGVYWLDGRPARDQVVRPMVDRMRHRGPDEQAVWTGGSVGLGHCMLRTTPESVHASLPQKSDATGCVITADARIDNRGELCGALDLHPGGDPVIPDSTILLRAYEKWGVDCVDHLLGAFTFAVWDPRANRLFCTQDHFGVRQFYYYHQPGTLFAFASEIKALFCLEPVPKVPNEVRIAEHLMAPVEDDVTRTYFKDIKRLAPAHRAVVTRDSASTRRYWALDPDREVELPSEEAYAERFGELFEEAVRARLRSAGPVGSMLSGGLDSSSIVSQAVHLLRESDADSTLHTFSAVFGESEQSARSNERPYIDKVLEEFDELRPHFIRGDRKSPLAEWDELSPYLDGACHAGNIYIYWRAHRRAREQNVRVLLDGFDGDTTVSHGLGLLSQLRDQGRWLRLVREAWQYAKSTGESPRGVVWSWVKGPLLSLPGISHLVSARRLVKEFAAPSDTSSSDANGEDPPVWKRALSDELIESVRPHLQAEEHDLMPTLQRKRHHKLLMRPVMKRVPDIWSHPASASSLEIRYPFFDKRLVEYCLAVPPGMKLKDGWSRYVMRRGMEGVLPKAIQWRRGKGNLSFALDHSMTTHERDLLEKLGNAQIGGVEDFVSPDFLREYVSKYLDGQVGTGESSGSGLIVSRVLFLALWLRDLGERSKSRVS